MNYPYQNNTQFLQNLMLQQTQQQSQPQIIEVSGKNGVDAFYLPPNCSALLLDNTAPRIWMVKADGAGYKTSVAWKISREETEEESQYKTLEERISKLEETINAKSNIKPSTRKSESE